MAVLVDLETEPIAGVKIEFTIAVEHVHAIGGVQYSAGRWVFPVCIEGVWEWLHFHDSDAAHNARETLRAAMAEVGV
jgi:hypothetical protein